MEDCYVLANVRLHFSPDIVRSLLELDIGKIMYQAGSTEKRSFEGR